MSGFIAPDPDFERRVTGSFGRQPFMDYLDARMVSVTPGGCEVRLPYRHELTQQHGFFHGGVTGALADTAAGYAAYSLMPADSTVLTTEYKINLLAPARGEELVARGQVKKAGRTLTVVESEVFGVEAGEETLIAHLLATMLCLHGKVDGPQAEGGE
jgi:uncharacterized protein (TIGR00369 family)